MPEAEVEKPNRRVLLGRRGEQLAATHLEAQGFVAIARNQRTRYGEIDLVAFDGSTLAFVEVKTRRVRSPHAGRSGTAGEGWESVRAEPTLGWPASRQRRRLRRLALAWLCDRAQERPSARNIRFDVIKVLLAADERLVALEHVEGAC
jgi:putative endonuclease